MFRKAFWSTLLGGFLLLGSVAPMQARNYDRNCGQHIRKAEQQLARAIRRHGYNSRQAFQARRHLEQTRARCSYRHRGRW